MKIWLVFAVALLMLPAAYADNTVSLYISASSGYQGMPVNANFYYSGLSFYKFTAGWGTSSSTCAINCQAYYSSSQTTSTTIPYYTGTIYYTVTAYDTSNNVLATISAPFNVNYPYQPYYPYQSAYCTQQYLNTYQCIGNQLQQLYQNSNCNTQWTTVQKCVAGCFSPSQSVGYCLGTGYPAYQGICQPNSQVCNGNYIQKCNPDGMGWNYNYQYCSNGCVNGVCTSPTCEAKFTGSPACSGDFVSRKYQEPDCSVGTRIQQYCVNGCLEGNCLPAAGKASVQLDPAYTAEACDVTAITFKIKNTGETQSDFRINASGDASAWLRLPSAVTLDKGEEKALVGLASVPCDAKGSKAFSISVKDGTTNTQNSVITVAGENAAPVSPSMPALAGLAAIAFVFVLLYKSGLLKRYLRSYKKTGESF
jgi:hypothetical protein